MLRSKTNFQLTGIFIEDPDDNSITGFFSEVPEAVAQGETIEETEDKLFNFLADISEVKTKMINEEALIKGISSLVKTKFYNFKPAI